MNRFCAKTNQFLYFRASESLSLIAIRKAHRPTLRGCGGAAPTMRGGAGGATPHHKGVWGRSPHLSLSPTNVPIPTPASDFCTRCESSHNIEARTFQEVCVRIASGAPGAGLTSSDAEAQGTQGLHSARGNSEIAGLRE